MPPRVCDFLRGPDSAAAGSWGKAPRKLRLLLWACGLAGASVSSEGTCSSGRTVTVIFPGDTHWGLGGPHDAPALPTVPQNPTGSCSGSPTPPPLLPGGWPRGWPRVHVTAMLAPFRGSVLVSGSSCAAHVTPQTGSPRLADGQAAFTWHSPQARRSSQAPAAAPTRGRVYPHRGTDSSGSEPSRRLPRARSPRAPERGGL